MMLAVSKGVSGDVPLGSMPRFRVQHAVRPAHSSIHYRNPVRLMTNACIGLSNPALLVLTEKETMIPLPRNAATVPTPLPYPCTILHIKPCPPKRSGRILCLLLLYRVIVARYGASTDSGGKNAAALQCKSDSFVEERHAR
ncbi:hypothetical protein HBI56_158090 [Parastagonospora nodorum]|uniref:Uncharacterized protein n=1 Tax=Phaeosphaeria nodorum (strain SN15 / ATCC MYA-4574 / FGSC 10173) TaxID=321614 RepID=A0A7U2HVJ8_PHANO|nr:hypothetical protein HBH56_188830 [Parastagonospora nodorum]QRC92278.1 hypothetical protein JI435_024150 [Parastagonospora nodorum SN15]KAH3925224.1 hypothetical protein HBH54_184640 [Parastagonospora nodorum]KAH3954393.1 hypothetical protein HBH53_023990 [Parastagonospora nodorum]KAH3963735.1 hypothetical protein HBH51_163820 [Parastagonospora nodorum]